MKLVLGVVVLAGEQEGTVQLLDDGVRVEVVHSEGIKRHGIQVLPDDLVAVDRSECPPAIVFRWALTRVKRVEGDLAFVDRFGAALPLADGLEVDLLPGDRVYATRDQVHDTCSAVLPKRAERFRAALPGVAAFLERMAGRASSIPAPRVEARTDAREVRYVTAETRDGREAIQEVMAHSYSAEIDERQPSWAMARVVDGVPVSFTLVNSDKRMGFPGGEVRYAFVNDVATREDRRREGHFRALMEHVFARLREADIPLVLLHGRYPLYRQFGFDVFTHHCGIFCTPGQIDRVLGLGNAGDAEELLTVGRTSWDDLLLVTDVKAPTPQSWKRALRAAGELAQAQGKERILFEYPACDSRYSVHATLETPLAVLARTCGGHVRVQGADPESGSIPDADWIKILDAAGFVQRVLDVLGIAGAEAPDGQVCLETDAGAVTIGCQHGALGAHDGVCPGVETVRWPSSALAQLVTGYRSAEMLDDLYETHVSPSSLSLLRALFPPRWRLSRNESWTYRA